MAALSFAQGGGRTHEVAWKEQPRAAIERSPVFGFDSCVEGLELVHELYKFLPKRIGRRRADAFTRRAPLALLRDQVEGVFQ